MTLRYIYREFRPTLQSLKGQSNYNLVVLFFHETTAPGQQLGQVDYILSMTASIKKFSVTVDNQVISNS
jgi:hypothetical protein